MSLATDPTINIAYSLSQSCYAGLIKVCRCLSTLLLAFQRRKQKVAGGAVAYIGIKLTPHSLEREGGAFLAFFQHPRCPLARTSAGGFASVGTVLFCSAQELLLLFEPLSRCSALRASNMFECCFLHREFQN